jgi:hypothetical protein
MTEADVEKVKEDKGGDASMYKAKGLPLGYGVAVHHPDWESSNTAKRCNIRVVVEIRALTGAVKMQGHLDVLDRESSMFVVPRALSW